MNTKRNCKNSEPGCENRDSNRRPNKRSDGSGVDLLAQYYGGADSPACGRTTPVHNSYRSILQSPHQNTDLLSPPIKDLDGVRINLAKSFSIAKVQIRIDVLDNRQQYSISLNSQQQCWLMQRASKWGVGPEFKAYLLSQDLLQKIVDKLAEPISQQHTGEEYSCAY